MSGGAGEAQPPPCTSSPQLASMVRPMPFLLPSAADRPALFPRSLPGRSMAPCVDSNWRPRDLASSGTSGGSRNTPLRRYPQHSTVSIGTAASARAGQHRASPALHQTPRGMRRRPGSCKGPGGCGDRADPLPPCGTGPEGEVGGPPAPAAWRGLRSRHLPACRHQRIRAGVGTGAWCGAEGHLSPSCSPKGGLGPGAEDLKAPLGVLAECCQAPVDLSLGCGRLWLRARTSCGSTLGLCFQGRGRTLGCSEGRNGGTARGAPSSSPTALIWEDWRAST